MIRFAALGDSVTVGIGDPMPHGGWRGWAALLAESLAPPGEAEFRNVSSSGAMTGDVTAEQLPLALAARPTVASLLVGVNDTLRGRFDLAEIAADVEKVVAALRESGTIVLTATLPDPGVMLRIPKLFRRPLARRVHAINAVVEQLARDHGTIHLDLAGDPAIYDRSMWARDRLHPSERGHRLLARMFAAVLVEHGVPVVAVPEPEARNPAPSIWTQVRWMSTKGSLWMAKRSRDLFPKLLCLVASEWWHGVRGRTDVLDARARAELAGVLGRLRAERPAAPLPAPGRITGQSDRNLGGDPGCDTVVAV
ncbi:MAG: SGNH/GDSL hydrolase family protein [Actinomadura sp.]